MNSVREIERLNARELELGGSGSWHDDYKDSAYVYVGGLPYQLTEGDVITIMSQFGEVVDVSLPRDGNTGKPKGFAFVMYADQRSTVLAVDNLTGSKVLDRTLRVDHVKNYKQLERDQETGKMKERDTQRLAAHPSLFAGTTDTGNDSPVSDASSSHPSIDPDDPMRDYLIEQRRAAKKSAKKRKSKNEGETPEERKERRERKKAKLRAAKAIEDRPRSSRDHDRDRHRGDDDRSERRRAGRRDDDAGYRRDAEDRRRRDLGRDDGRSRRDHGGSRDDRGSRFADLEKWASKS